MAQLRRIPAIRGTKVEPIGLADSGPSSCPKPSCLSRPYRLLVCYGGTLIRVSRTSPDGASHMPTGDWHSPGNLRLLSEVERMGRRKLAQSLISTRWRRESRRNRNAASDHHDANREAPAQPLGAFHRLGEGDSACP